MRFLAKSFAFVALACAPISLFTIGWGLALVAQEVPIWLFLIMCASVVAVLIGLGLREDGLRQKYRQQQRGRSFEHPHF